MEAEKYLRDEGKGLTSNTASNNQTLIIFV